MNNYNSGYVDHFSELLNRRSPTETPSIAEAPSELEVNCERPSKEEIVKAIKKLKSEKAAEPDNIPPEALEADPYTTAGMLYELFGKTWEEEEMPTGWNESYIIKLPKKGDMRECKNYRRISILIVVG